MNTILHWYFTFYFCFEYVRDSVQLLQWFIISKAVFPSFSFTHVLNIFDCEIFSNVMKTVCCRICNPVFFLFVCGIFSSCCYFFFLLLLFPFEIIDSVQFLEIGLIVVSTVFLNLYCFHGMFGNDSVQMRWDKHKKKDSVNHSSIFLECYGIKNTISPYKIYHEV